jgi:predicted TIM-barrel fold metal-dependent hydrolase
MLTRREVLIGVAATGASALVRGARNAYAAAPQPATLVNFKVPPGACDTHTHLFGDQRRFPYAPTSNYRHEPATPDDLRVLHRALHVDRVVIIQPSGYGTDNSCTLDGVKQLGSGARAVVAIDDKTPDAALDGMHRAGARGIRVNIGQTVPEARQRLQAAAQRLAGRKWHINTAVQLSMLEGLWDQFMAIQVPIVLDHWVSARPSLGVGQPGFDVLLKLLQTGKVYLKITHRVHTLSTQGPDYPDAALLARVLIAASPQRILWGTDWPHAGIRPPGYERTDISPYVQVDDGRLFNQFPVWAPDPAQRETILVNNPARLYDF